MYVNIFLIKKIVNEENLDLKKDICVDVIVCEILGRIMVFFSYI